MGNDERHVGTSTSERVGPAAGPLVEVRGISKHFGGVRALEDVSISFGRGTVHGLVGENGAGKSTLTKAIGGAHQPDDGEILVDGEPVRFSTPRDALEQGIALIAQEIALVPEATVEENVFLGAEPRRAGMVDRGALRRAYRELDERVGFGLPGRSTVGACVWPTGRRSRSCERWRGTRG